MKYFPDCYCYDEGELNRILSVAIAGQKSASRSSLKSRQKAGKPHHRKPLPPMPKMKAGAMRNDKGEETEKPR